MVKTIKIGDKDVALRSSGATYIKFRNEFKKDLFVELNKINKSAVENDGELPDFAIETLLEATYIMMKQANKDVTKSFEDWLDEFELVESLQGLEGVLTMLNEDKQDTTVDAKKKNEPPTE